MGVQVGVGVRVEVGVGVGVRVGVGEVGGRRSCAKAAKWIERIGSAKQLC